MAVVGKYTWLKTAPDSYTTWESGISTDSRCGNQWSLTGPGSADSNKFFSTSRESTIRASLAIAGKPASYHSAQPDLRLILTGMYGSVHRATPYRPPQEALTRAAPYSVSGWPLGNWCAYQVASRCRIVFSLT